MKVIPLIEGPFPDPTTDLEQVKADVKEFGYGIVKSALTPKEVHTLKSVITEKIKEAEEAGHIGESYTDRDAVNRRLRSVVDTHMCFRNLVDHPLAMEMAEFMLGPTYLDESYLLQGINVNMTRPGSKSMGVHGDTDYMLPFYDVATFARVIWVVDDFDEEVGATRVVPKSHTFGYPPKKDGSVEYETIPIIAPAGSAVFYDGRLYHCTGANTSNDRERAAIFAGYTPPWIRQQQHFPSTLNPEVMKDASERCRQLLGYSSLYMGFDFPWKYVGKEIAALSVGQKRSVESMRNQVRQD